MNVFSILGIALTGVAILIGGWLGCQLLRQNGRILLRLDELEKRLDKLEFGEGDEPAGLLLGSEAPAFELPDLAGGRRSLAQFRGQPVLLIFFNPACGFCREMMPKLGSYLSEGRAPRVRKIGEGEDHGLVELGPPSGSPGECKLSVLVVSTGGAEANQRLFDEHNISCPVLVQKDSEVAMAYKANGTPSGYLISAEGKIASELAMGVDALLALVAEPRSSRGNEAQISLNSQPEEQSLLTSAATGDGNGRTDRFSNRSLARSKIKRDGLKAGTPAPEFRLPRLDGRGDLSLQVFRGRRVLLVFSSPHCGPCDALAPELEKFHREQKGPEVGRVTPCAPQNDGASPNGAHGVARPTSASTPITVVMISKGEPKENRAKVTKHGLTFPIVLQQQWEMSRRYAMFATPIAYLIDPAGVISHDVAVGVDAIQTLMAQVRAPGPLDSA